MEATLDIEFLRGLGPDPIIRELPLALDCVLQTFHFKPPYPMNAHGSKENGLNWNDGHIPYDQLHRVLNEAVANFDHPYAYWSEKCEIFNTLLIRPIHNYEDLKCPEPNKLKSEFRCYMTCHSFPHMRCATRTAYALHKWLRYFFNTKSYISFPKDNTRHTAQFASGIQQN